MEHFLKITSCFIVLLVVSSPVCCELLVNPVSIVPLDPIDGESATLTCLAVGFNTTGHDFIWNRLLQGNLIEVTAGTRISISQIQQNAFGYFQTLTISSLEKSDEGIYICIVADKMNRNHISNSQGSLLVNCPDDFPICNPVGPAVVNEGDTLTCRIVIDARTLAVRTFSDPSGDTSWIEVSPEDSNTNGSALQRNVSTQIDGITYICFSLLTVNESGLTCLIGPLTVIPSDDLHTSTPSTSSIPMTTSLPQDLQTSTPSASSIPPNTILPLVPSPVLSIGAIIGIALVAFLLLLLLLVHTICCRCNPKRWLNAKSYLSGLFRQEEAKRELDNNPCYCTTIAGQEDQTLNVMGTQNVKMSQNEPNYQNVEVEGTLAAPHTNYNVEPHTADTATTYEIIVDSLETKRIAEGQGTTPDETASIPIQAQTYMKLNLPDENPDVYTELKL